jgi:probable HAF family extracellular repeat protein
MVLIFSIAATLATTAAQAAEPKYRVDFIGQPGNYFDANGLNDLGEITGSFNFDSGPLNVSAFLFRAGRMTKVDPPGLGFAYGTDINNRTEIVGSVVPVGSSKHLSFLYRNGHLMDLGTELGALDVDTRAINDHGHAVGSADGRPFFFDGNTSRYLNFNVFGTVVPNDINNAGAIAGNLEGTSEAFIYQDGRLTHLPSLGGGVSYANALNESGQVVGRSLASDERMKPVLFQNGTVVALAPQGNEGEARDINDKGWIVGNVLNSIFLNTGFLYHDGSMHDLNDLLLPRFADRVQIFSANEINESGQILVRGSWLTGPHRGNQPLLLTPIPEPATVVLMLVGLGIVGAAATWRRKSSA